MIDFTKPVFTQDGHEVIILDHTTLTGSYPIVGIVKNGEALTDVTTWTREGQYYVGEEGNTDLTNDCGLTEAPLPGYPPIIAKYHGCTMVGVRWSD